MSGLELAVLSEHDMRYACIVSICAHMRIDIYTYIYIFYIYTHVCAEHDIFSANPKPNLMVCFLGMQQEINVYVLQHMYKHMTKYVSIYTYIDLHIYTVRLLLLLIFSIADIGALPASIVSIRCTNIQVYIYLFIHTRAYIRFHFSVWRHMCLCMYVCMYACMYCASTFIPERHKHKHGYTYKCMHVWMHCSSALHLHVHE